MALATLEPKRSKKNVNLAEDLQYAIDLLESCALDSIQGTGDLSVLQNKAAHVFIFHVSRKLKEVKKKLEKQKKDA